LIRVELRFAVGVHRNPLIGEKGALGVLESSGILEPKRHILKAVSTKDALQLLVLSPDFRFEAGAVCGNAADDVPVPVGKARHITDVHVREAAGELGAHTNLALAECEAAPPYDLDVATDLECLVRHATGDNVGDIAAEPAMDVDDDLCLRAHQRTAIGSGGNVRRRADDADGIARNSARELAVGSAAQVAQQAHVARRSCLRECGDEPVRPDFSTPML
jgi:hypothetical protein